MIALKIEDKKQFTSCLFVGTVFDHFLVREVDIVTFNTFHMDGHIKQGYYSEEELEKNQIEVLSSWEVLKPICFSLIKGKKMPGSFHIVLQLTPTDTEQFLKTAQKTIQPDQINGLYLNIRFEDGTMNCVTGTSVTFFTMDKSLEKEWDDATRLFFKLNKIPFVEE